MSEVIRIVCPAVAYRMDGETFIAIQDTSEARRSVLPCGLVRHNGILN